MRAIILTLAATSLVLQAAVGAQTPSLPTPESVLGYRVGADYKIATYDETVDYFQKLDAASDRMTMMRAGTSTQGRTYWLAAISSAANLKKIDRYREIARRLARPAGLSEADAKRWRARARPSCTSMAGCTRPKWPDRSTRCSWPTTCWRRPTTPSTRTSSTTSS